MKRTKYITIPELARILGISRIAVYNKVKKGQIKAAKIGKSYVISRKHVDYFIGEKLTTQDKKMLDSAIKKTIDEYGETLKLLGRE